jgi:DNA recombination protein RmuC
MEILFLIIGIAVGAAIAWFWSKSQAMRQLQAEKEQSLAAHAAVQSQAQADREQRVAAETRLQEIEKQRQSEAALVEEARKQLGDTFKAISSDALRQNSEEFVQRAQQTLEPVKDTLKRYEEQIKAIENAYRQTYGSLDQQLKSLLVSEQQLQRETSNLVTALRRPEVRGRWGELTLHRVVELAGLSEHCDYVEQVSVQSDGGRMRPDMVINLPAGRQVVIDAKCSLDAYLSAVEAPDDNARKLCLARHCQQLRDHMNSLAQKSYWDQFSAAPEFVVMFVPGESFLAAAMDHDPSLIEDGLQKKVLLASPINLIALLRAVAYGWRQEQIGESAQKVSDLGQELYKRLRVFAGHLANVGKRLDSAVDAYNDAVGSLERSVLPGARRFPELGAARGEEIPELEPVDVKARQLAAPEAGEEA